MWKRAPSRISSRNQSKPRNRIQPVACTEVTPLASYFVLADDCNDKRILSPCLNSIQLVQSIRDL